ncbi:uncharacterized protein LOC117900708 isoform X1 [Drosophila subobscura]|uniref:uncharacterized protein LOC117900708 isoform X1 n=1 Tax=Drosophila subobscura TaxID=7241 RepID=UPI00155A4D29|nr:uncharacterized protein LOC117900708 isoform X1 [Drosophila subobscura]
MDASPRNSKDDNEQMSTGPHNITEYSQTPLWRPSIPCVPMPCHRGPLVLQKEASKVDSQFPKDDTKLKLNRRDYLRQMYKDNRMNLIEKKAATDMQMDSTKSTKEFLNPARLEFVNLKWKERQEEIEKRQQETDKKYVSRFEMNAGRKERII